MDSVTTSPLAGCGRPRCFVAAAVAQVFPTHTQASDELHFPTALAILGILVSNYDDNDNSSNAVQTEMGGECRKQRVTYADWFMSAKNSALFHSYDLKVTELARKEGCLIARKFSQRVEIQNWKDVVLGESTNEGRDKT